MYLINASAWPSKWPAMTERVVARWRHLVAFMKDRVTLHWAMPHVPHQRLRLAIKIACDGVAKDHVMVH